VKVVQLAGVAGYDSSHVAWNIVIGKQGYHMAVCASGKVKPPGDDAQYATYLQYERYYTSTTQTDHRDILVIDLFDIFKSELLKLTSIPDA
jgi:hypothetical protein